MIACDNIEQLRRERPEWSDWLARVALALGEMESAAWDELRVTGAASRERSAPLLAGSLIETPAHALRGVNGLFEAAPDMNALLEATLNGDDEVLAAYAAATRDDADALTARAALAVKPLLHACRRAHATGLRQPWPQSYCQLCGARPAFVEVRGIDRLRYLRCGDCGSEWETQCLDCAFCGNTDHEQLGSLVPEANAAAVAIDICNACGGYMKVFTTLSGAGPAAVLLRDLATSELDIAAMQRGYRRPASRGYALAVRVKNCAPGARAA